MNNRTTEDQCILACNHIVDARTCWAAGCVLANCEEVDHSEYWDDIELLWYAAFKRYGCHGPEPGLEKFFLGKAQQSYNHGAIKSYYKLKECWMWGYNAIDLNLFRAIQRHKTMSARG